MRIWLVLIWLNVAGGDQDRDLIPDSEEQYLLERFLPRFHVAVGDCDVKPAEFERGKATPVVKERNGTIYGQVFRIAGGVEIHYFHLWANDCGRIPHELDAEHVSAFVVQQEKEWRARYWYSAAHEDTVCDRGAAARAQFLLAEWRGPDVWVSRGKHASFLSEEACRLGCGSDKCDRSENLVVKQVLNLGERGNLLNGSRWAEGSGWRLGEKMGSDFPADLRKQLDGSQKIIAAKTRNPVVQPVILAGSSTIDSLELANTKTGGALSKAKKSVKKLFEKYRF